MNQICVANCQRITDVALKLIVPLDQIVILNLSGCTRCPNLIYLNLHNCQLVTDTGIQAMTAMASLAYLNISRIGITDQGLESLGRHLKIKEIILSECRLISDTGMKVLCTELKKLDYVDLSFCRHISNATLKNLSLNCRKLTCLIMVGCVKVHQRFGDPVNSFGVQFPALSGYFGGDELMMPKKLKKRRYSTMVPRPSIVGTLGEKDVEHAKLPLIETVTEQAVEESLISPGSLAEDP
ncbi:hypothetical protein Chor_002514 [Crotalus horridus]